MKSVKTLMDEGVLGSKLSILVFGPQVKNPASDERTLNLQNKRKEIRKGLEDLGHHVKFAEDLVDPSLPAPVDNAMLQEIAIMKEYDFIVTLVDSPGSIAEATYIAVTPTIAQKASFFIDADHNEGFVAQTCKIGVFAGAVLQTYEYPKDLVECHLLGSVKRRVAEIQALKFIM